MVVVIVERISEVGVSIKITRVIARVNPQKMPELLKSGESVRWTPAGRPVKTGHPENAVPS